MTGLLTLDVGRVMGWSYGSLLDPMPVEIGCHRLPTSSVRDLLGSRLDALDHWLDLMLTRLGPDAVALAERFRSRTLGEASTNYALDGLVRLHCYRRRISVLCQPENTVRKEVLGRGSGPSEELKRLALDWCRARGIAVVNDHEADSAVFWFWANRELTKNVTTSSGLPNKGQPHVVARKKRNILARKTAALRLKPEAGAV